MSGLGSAANIRSSSGFFCAAQHRDGAAHHLPATPRATAGAATAAVAGARAAAAETASGTHWAIPDDLNAFVKRFAKLKF